MQDHNEQKIGALNSTSRLKGVENDIHNSRQKIESWKARIKEKFRNKSNVGTVIRFLDRLKLLGRSDARVADYAFCCYKILELQDKKQIRQWTKEDVEKIAKAIVDRNYSNSVKSSILRTIKRLVHFAKNDEIVTKKDGIDYCDEVKWLVPGAYYDKHEKIKPQDLVTDEEFLKIVNAVPKVSKNVKRDIALLYVEREFAARPAELLNMRVGGVEFKDRYMVVTSYGKTGQKTLALVISYKPLLEWMNEHPYNDDPEAYLWYENNKEGRITYQQLFKLLKAAVKEAGIKKRIWNYLHSKDMARHTK